MSHPTMKKILLYTAALMALTGCSDSFLDTENLTQKDSSNFPVTNADAEQISTAMYRPMIADPNNPYSSSFLVAELMSDERFGAGGTDDKEGQSVAAFKKLSENQYSSYWSIRWEGIYRANFLLKCDPNIAWDSDADRSRMLGEAYYCRAYYYFELARAFGHVPLVLDPDPVNLPQADPADMFGQICADLLTAIDMMPATRWTDGSGVGTNGHATKWAAEALLARVFLFYTGYYQVESVTLPDEAGVLTKADVVKHVDDCVQNSGHALLSDFRNLWPYSAVEDYKYVVDNGLSWIGEIGGHNSEVLFAVKHSGNDWSARNNEALFFSLRYQDEGGNGYADCYPYGSGWGIGTVVPNIYETWPIEDPRRSGSVLNVDDDAEGFTAYYDGCQNQVHDTHLFNKKYTAISTRGEGGSYLGGDIVPLYWSLYPSLTLSTIRATIFRTTS